MAIAQNKKKSEKDRLTKLLVDEGIRPTRQRMALAELLFDGTHKHVTAEQVLELARKSRARVSLATVYNTLHSFTQAGLLREISVDQSSNYFDTNIDTHYHFYDEATGKVCDIPADAIRTECLPPPPEGREIGRVDVTIRLRKTS